MLWKDSGFSTRSSELWHSRGVLFQQESRLKFHQSAKVGLIWYTNLKPCQLRKHLLSFQPLPLWASHSVTAQLLQTPRLTWFSSDTLTPSTSSLPGCIPWSQSTRCETTCHYMVGNELRTRNSSNVPLGLLSIESFIQVGGQHYSALTRLLSKALPFQSQLWHMRRYLLQYWWQSQQS